MLRQPLLRGLVDAGLDVTVVARRGPASIVTFLDPRLSVVECEISPYDPAPPDVAPALHRLGAALDACGAELVVAAAFNRTWLDEWILARTRGARRVGLVDHDRPAAPIAIRPAGVAIPASSTLDEPVSCRQWSHEAEKSRALLRTLTGADPTAWRPALVGIEPAVDVMPGAFVYGCPRGTATNGAKAWPAAAFAKLVAHLASRHGLPTLLAGIASEAAAIEQVAAACRARGADPHVWIGPADDAAPMLRRIAASRVYLGTDSGPMHVAGALGKPIVASFGGGHWPRFLPLGRPAFVGTQMLPCHGCEWRCWLDAPRCVPDATAPFRDALDAIVAGTADDLAVHLGTPVGADTIERLRTARSDGRGADGRRLLDEVLARPQASPTASST